MAAGGRDIRIGGGADLIQQYLNAGLVNEFTISIAPESREGTRLFDRIEFGQVGLEVVDTIPSASDPPPVCSEPRIAPRFPTRRVPQEDRSAVEARVRVRERRVFGGVELGRVRGDGSHNTLVELVNVARGNDAGRSVRPFIPGYGIDGHCAGAGYGEEPQELGCGPGEFSRGLLASLDDLIAALDGCAPDENPLDIGCKVVIRVAEPVSGEGFSDLLWGRHGWSSLKGCGRAPSSAGEATS